MCNESGKECNSENCQCQLDTVGKELKFLLSRYNKELSECESAIKRTEGVLNNLGVQRQQLIGARFAIESAIAAMNKPIKGESKDVQEEKT